MKTIVVCSLAAIFAGASATAAPADVTPEQKKTLSELSKSLREARTLARKKQFDEVRQAISDAEAKIGEMGLAEDERDRTYRSVVRSIASLKNALPVSFEKEVAPIIKTNCIRCHGASRQSAQLRLDTYNHMARGGMNGPLVRGTNPRNSLLVVKIATNNPQHRMPKNGTPLPDDQIDLIARWVSQGSLYDGTDRDSEIGSSPKRAMEKPIVIARPDGSETVSFKNDIAPWMVNICLGCHGGRNPRNNYSLATFEQLLKGGDSGPPVVPGDADNSYLIDLVLRQDPLKMPAGNQTRIKRSQAVALETWVNEGAKFDGGDPKAPLRDLVPTAAELEARRLAAMSESEFTERRVKQGQDMWKRVLPRDEVAEVQTASFNVFAADEDKAKQVSEWAEKDAEAIRSFFRFKGDKIWRGRLNVFVARDRFAYEEFNQVVFNRQTPKEMTGHAVVTSGFNQAYVVIEDNGDEVTEASAGVRTNLTVQLTEAFVMRSGNTPPRIISRGAGLLLAARTVEKNDPWFAALPQRLKSASVAQPGEVFDDGAFSAYELDGVAYALAVFLSRASPAKFVQFVGELQSGATLATATRKVYRQSPDQIGRAFMQSVR